MNKQKKIEELRESIDSGIISKEEFEKQLKKIEEGPEHKIIEDPKNTEEVHVKESKKSDKTLIFLILGTFASDRTSFIFSTNLSS